MAYQGPERRFQTDEAKGLAELSVKIEVPVDKLPLRRQADKRDGWEEELRSAAKRKLLEAAGVSPEKAAAELSSVTPEEPSAETQPSVQVEAQPPRLLSFAESVRFLDGKLDLEAARTAAVKSHSRWRLVDALVKAGAIKDVSEYAALFDKATIGEADLKKARESLERGKKVLPIFDAGKMTPDKLFAVLFTEGGVPHYTDSYGFKNLAKLRRIDPRNIPGLANLARKSREKQLAAFKVAYEEAEPLEPTGARVTFTPDNREVSRTGTSATEDMQVFAKGGMKFVGLNEDMIRFRTQMDAGLRKIAGGRGDFDSMDNVAYRAFLDKAFTSRTFLDRVFTGRTIDKYMPDRERITRYPNYAFENGAIPGLDFETDSRKVYVYDYVPSGAHVNLGSRLSLG